jgi:hypothetical protein
VYYSPSVPDAYNEDVLDAMKLNQMTELSKDLAIIAYPD